jgi:hypothetical protein
MEYQALQIFIHCVHCVHSLMNFEFHRKRGNCITVDRKLGNMPDLKLFSGASLSSKIDCLIHVHFAALIPGRSKYFLIEARF